MVAELENMLEIRTIDVSNTSTKLRAIPQAYFFNLDESPDREHTHVVVIGRTP